MKHNLRIGSLFLCMAIPVGRPQADDAESHVTTREEWVSFEGANPPGVRFETKIPATTALVEGPAGRRAISVTVPDLRRDEKACAFAIALPRLGVEFNGVKLWLKGSGQTKHLEVVFRTRVGSFGTDLPIGLEWREVVLGPSNTRPYLGTREGRLEMSHTTEARFCLWEREDEQSGPRSVSIGPITAIRSPVFDPAGPVASVNAPKVPLSLQPFTVELLDAYRGHWQFSDPLGQHLHLEERVFAYAFSNQSQPEVRLAYLCCDPEFPSDLSHAVLKVASPTQRSEGASWFRLEEPYFSCAASVRPVGHGAFLCELYHIALGPATQGDRYVEGLYLMAGDHAFPLWLAPGETIKKGPKIRLLTNRVGNVFVDNEPVKVTLAGLCPAEGCIEELSLRAIDYATKEVLWSGRCRLACKASAATSRIFLIPLTRFGVFEVKAKTGVQEAHVRVCRLPARKRISPDFSSIGINLFQQQIWWYAFQVPLMAKAGVHWLRPWLAWENTWNTQEPEPGKWDTRALDTALRRMDAYSLRYQDILFQAPAWLEQGDASRVPPINRMDEWGEYVERLVRRYKGRLRCYEVWNEPDGMWPESTRRSGEHYMAMLKSTWEAAKRADPNCVILGLSHAGYEQWLQNVCKLGAGRFMDAATIHVYAKPGDFVEEVRKRREILKHHGMADKPLWINELGASAYDFNPEYSAKFDCSEQKQAAILVADYALALSCDPRMKAFWFCTYDPRDAAQESQWTGDAGIGVLYLGFLPKLSYAALAGFARRIDGKRCLGCVDITRDLHQVSFDGPIAVSWDDRPGPLKAIPATQLGGLPEERLTVRDLFTNVVASGSARDVKLDFSRGPFYIEGSRQMAGIARAESAVQVEPGEVALLRGRSEHCTLVAPPNARIVITPSPAASITARLLSDKPSGMREIAVTARDLTDRLTGVVQIRATVEPPLLGLVKPAEVVRAVAVMVGGGPNLIRDGGFTLGTPSNWAPQRNSAYAWDLRVGHTVPGSLRLDAPFDRRLVHWNITPRPGGALKFRGWIKADRLSGCIVTLNLALFGPEGWLKTWCLATNSAPGEIEGGWRTVEKPGLIPTGSADWTLVETTVSPNLIPTTADRAAFFIDAKGGGEGSLWFDDLDLWEPERKG